MVTTPGSPLARRRFWTDRQTRARFVRMLRSFARSEAGHKARWLFAGLILLLVAINGLNVLNSYVGRDFMTALEQRGHARFTRQALLYVAVFAASTLADVFLRFTEETLSLTWREWLSRWAVQRYLTPPVYHRLSDRLIADGGVSNPDERISDDMRAFTTTSLSFVILLLNGSFTILAFSGVLWSISPPLFVVTLIYAALGSVLAIARGRPLVRLNVAQLDREADFRAELIRVRENAEPLAIARREPRMLARLLRRIDAFVENFRRIIMVNRNLGFFTTGYNYLIQIIPALIVGPLFIRGDVPFGVVTQSAMAFAQLVGAFSLIITQFQSISAYAAVMTRLGKLDEGMEEAQSHPVPPKEVCPHHSRTSSCPLCASRPLPDSTILVTDSGPEPAVTFEHLTLLSPSDGRVLTKELNGVVPPGMRLWITGPDEEAKTALFRATAGTWVSGSGGLRRPGDVRMLFVAERPYLPPGTLREVLTDSTEESAVRDEELRSILRDLDLGPVLVRGGGLDQERRWDHLLSLGEQQLLSFAVVLLAAPSIVFLERPGSALGAAQRARLLGRLADRSMTMITIGNTGDPSDGYGAELVLEGGGAWRWTPLPA